MIVFLVLAILCAVVGVAFGVWTFSTLWPCRPTPPAPRVGVLRDIPLRCATCGQPLVHGDVVRTDGQGQIAHLACPAARVRDMEAAAGGLLLPGWTCPGCQAFNGSAKEQLRVCRCCGIPSPHLHLVSR
jgi:hypothetical protein